MRGLLRISFALVACFLAGQQATAQRTYAKNSVLASGNWVKLGVSQEGIYKIDAAMLSSMGFATGTLPSASIRLFGNGGAPLPENNITPRPDDLLENAILVEDGGDGVFNGNDYLLFYARGPHQWLKDSLNKRFVHQKNLYSDTAYYFISVGGTGSRISTKTITGVVYTPVNTYLERQFYEADLVNLLQSGKEWLGEYFSNNGGSGLGSVGLSKSFSVDWPNLVAGQPLFFNTAVAARSIGAASNFGITIGGQALQAGVAAISGYFLDAYAIETKVSKNLAVSQNPVAIQYNFQPGVSGAEGWLNWWEMQGKCSLSINGNKPLFFRDWESVGAGNIARFSITNASANTLVWDITEPILPSQMGTALNGSLLQFNQLADRLHEFVAFDKTNTLTPAILGKVANQNLHASSAADMLIVTHSSLLSEAQRLAAYHQQRDGLTVPVVTTDQIYNEFSGGIPDPVAIRDFVKMYYDKALLSGGAGGGTGGGAGGGSGGSGGALRTGCPKYLLLFGVGSYDPKNRIAGNTNLVPAFETANSLEPLLTHVSDDFFGLLDDSDDINLIAPAGLLDIAVGRIPARNAMEAKIMVDKIMHYGDKASFGAWRNQTVFIADDKDQNLHLNDAESLVAAVASSNGFINSDKVYLDAYPLVSGSGGGRYPAVNDAIVNEVFNGNLIVNYSGHGSYQRLAEESVLTQTEINRFNNPDKLPVFITASCDFAPYDDPSKNSLGNTVLMGSANGAIALLTTTRVVYAYSNRIMNENYVRAALKPNAAGQWPTLGEAVLAAKNTTYQGLGDVFNNRKFTLLGDPALRLALPQYQIKLTGINGKPITGRDSLQALGNYQLSGIITDRLGNRIQTFNGIIYPTIFDKPQQVKTLGNDPASPVATYSVQNSILFKGRATVTNGAFQFGFVVPKDINYQPGHGKISLYADNATDPAYPIGFDAGGDDTSFVIAGITTSYRDSTGPAILAYLNDTTFKNGGLTHENPVLLLHLYDSSGISVSGAGIGHDLTAVIDGNEKNVLVLNNYYSSMLDRFQEGRVQYQLPTLSEGRHSIQIKAWDVANHSAETTLDFVVAKQEKLAVTRVMNYPNPFTNITRFSFEHNQPNTDLQVAIDIYSQWGQPVKTIRQTIRGAGTRLAGIDWVGDDELGRKLKKGIYIYRVTVSLGEAMHQESHQLLLY